MAAEERAKDMDTFTGYTTTKKGEGQNYRTISLITRPSKAMLRCHPQQTKGQMRSPKNKLDFRARRSTVEQIFNCRVLNEEHPTPERPFPQLHRLDEPSYGSS